MQEGKTGNALKKFDHRRTHIEPILPSAPHLQRGLGNIKPLSGLPLRQSLDLQAAVLLKEFGASEASPALVTINIAPLFAIDDSTHSYLFPKQPSYMPLMAKDGEELPRCNPYGCRVIHVLGRYLYK
jgi:hypothetical protein